VIVDLAKPLLDLIARHESERAAEAQGVESGYDVVVWQAFKVYPPPKPLSFLTVAEVLDWQDEAIKRYKQKNNSRIGYSAAGRYQIIHSTLQGLVDSYWKMSDVFDASVQDQLGLQLLNRRGFNRWLNGRMPGGDSNFADMLSMEWASLPYRTGMSYYDKDAHGNKALVSRQEVMHVLKKIKNAANLVRD
jgi:hypothetical protein